MGSVFPTTDLAPAPPTEAVIDAPAVPLPVPFIGRSDINPLGLSGLAFGSVNRAAFAAAGGRLGDSEGMLGFASFGAGGRSRLRPLPGGGGDEVTADYPFSHEA
jgi:hypothetical protein